VEVVYVFLKCINRSLDTNNYKITGGKFYISKIEPVTEKSEYTHLLQIQTDELIDDSVKIEVIRRTPLWVRNSSSPDDSKIATDSSQLGRTFGIESLVDGITDAFNLTSGSRVISTIDIKVSKEHSSFKLGYLIFFIIVASLIAIIVIIKKSSK
jgi:hypothetical protein